MTLSELAQPTLPAALIASVSTDGASTVVALRGEADLFTLPDVIDVLSRVIAENDGPVIVDLAQIDFIDSSTMLALGRAWEYLGDRGRSLTVRNPSRLASRVLGLFGLAHVVQADPGEMTRIPGTSSRTTWIAGGGAAFGSPVEFS